VGEQSNIDEAITAAKHLIACYDGMIAGLTNGKPYTLGQQAALDITSVQKQKLFDALDQVAAELVMIDDYDEYNGDGDVDAASTYVEHGIVTKEEIKKSIGVDYLAIAYPKQGGKTAAALAWAHKPEKLPYEYTFGTYIAPTTFLSMDSPEPAPSVYNQIVTQLTVSQVQKVLNELYKTNLSTLDSPYPYTYIPPKVKSYEEKQGVSSLLLSHWSGGGLEKNQTLSVDDTQYLIKQVTHTVTGISLVIEPLKQAIAKTQVIVDDLGHALKPLFPKPEPYYVKFNKPKGKK
jgi:hypothetical protein